MDNQHRKITGYRELEQHEIDLMNEIKAKGQELEALIDKLQEQANDNLDEMSFDSMDIHNETYRWISIGRTHLQQGLMALTRAVAKPEFF